MLAELSCRKGKKTEEALLQLYVSSQWAAAEDRKRPALTAYQQRQQLVGCSEGDGTKGDQLAIGTMRQQMLSSQPRQTNSGTKESRLPTSEDERQSGLAARQRRGRALEEFILQRWVAPVVVCAVQLPRTRGVLQVLQRGQ